MATRGKQPKETDLAYIAGIIDGEGTVGIYKKKPKNEYQSPGYRERVAISSSNLEVLNYINKFFPGVIAKNTRYSSKHSPMFRLEYHVLRAIPILEAVSKYMIIKKKQAEKVLAYRKAITPIDPKKSKSFGPQRLSSKEIALRESYYQELKKLNLRGVQPQRLIRATT